MLKTIEITDQQMLAAVGVKSGRVLSATHDGEKTIVQLEEFYETTKSHSVGEKHG